MQHHLQERGRTEHRPMEVQEDCTTQGRRRPSNTTQKEVGRVGPVAPVGPVGLVSSVGQVGRPDAQMCQVVLVGWLDLTYSTSFHFKSSLGRNGKGAEEGSTTRRKEEGEGPPERSFNCSEERRSRVALNRRSELLEHSDAPVWVQVRVRVCHQGACLELGVKLNPSVETADQGTWGKTRTEPKRTDMAEKGTCKQKKRSGSRNRGGTGTEFVCPPAVLPPPPTLPPSHPPTHSSLERFRFNRRGASTSPCMEHRPRRKHQQLNSDTNASSETHFERPKKSREKEESISRTKRKRTKWRKANFFF